jgi:hypothetical protein
VPIAELIDRGDLLSLEISCKDTNREKYAAKIGVDFGEIKKQGRVTIHQQTSIETIAHHLQHIGENIEAAITYKESKDD